MNKKILFLLTAICILAAGQGLGGEPLRIIYAEPEEDDGIVESQQNYIDNQSYLKEFEKRRRERVLGSDQAGGVTVITRRASTTLYYPYGNRYPHSGENSFYGIEYQSGNTVFRYYDGYQPNCCSPIYVLRPRPKAPVVVPYHHNMTIKRKR